MHKVEKYKLRSVNYNILSKLNKSKLSNFNPGVNKINLLVKNRVINGQYLTLLSLFTLSLITNSKGTLLKSKKNNLYLNLKKNDNIGVILNLKNDALWDFYLKFITKYLPKANAKLKPFNKVETISAKLQNLHLIDKKLGGESSLQEKLDILVNFSNNKNISLNNMKLLLSHLGYPFKN